MARITIVEKARISSKTRVCRTCHQPIEEGQKYKHFSKQYVRTFAYHFACAIPASHQTSGKTAQLLEIQEGLDDNINAAGCIEDVKTALEESTSEAQGLADDYEEGASNIEDGFGHSTSQSEEMQEKGEAIREWSDALDQAASEVGDLEPDDEEESESDTQDNALLENAKEVATNASAECPS